MKKSILCIIICFVVFMSGCTNMSADSVQNISAPQNNMVPISGQWKITKFIGLSTKEIGKVNDSSWIGKILQFSSDDVAIGNYVWGSPEYKIKKVNTQEYFLLKHDVPLEKLNIKDKEILIITVTSQDNFLGDFIKINDNEMIAITENNYYYVSKISDDVDKSLVGNNSKSSSQYISMDSFWKGTNSKSGVLLGLKSPDGKTGEYSYRTLWIASNNKTLHPVMETDGIFFPRKSGFWRLNVNRVTDGNRTEDVLTASDVSNGSSVSSGATTPKIDNTEWGSKEGYIYRNIDFVCNDYVSLETTGEGIDVGNKEKWSENNLQIEPVDSLPSIKGVSITDLAGNDGLTAMQNAQEALSKTLNTTKEVIVKSGNDDENIGVTRKNGHWFIEGRVSISGAPSTPYLDYDIDLIPPEKLVAYDTLYIPWIAIKDKVPEAIDAYTSPNKDIALIVTKGNVYVYAINGGKLSEEPLTKIKLEKGESVIMAEWAMGNYVDNWEKSFLKNNVSILDTGK